MPKRKDNLFIDKFMLLNSQECNEEITWSSSPASDVENVSNNISFNHTSKTRHEKRKMKKSERKPKAPSYLNLEVIEVPCDISKREKSPILCNKSHLNLSVHSPILKPTRKRKHSGNKDKDAHLINHNVSPILTRKAKSSIFLQKSPSFYKVRKKILSDVKNSSDCTLHEQSNLDQIIDKKEKYSFNYSYIGNLSQSSKEIKIENLTPSENIEEYSSSQDSKSKVLEKVKSYFNNHFASGNTSGNSIQEDLSQKNSGQSDEIEIFTCPKQDTPTKLDIKNETKKFKYKKDGLAYRLSNLLKKQTANFNLWRHEKFMAGNTNFILPKSDFLIFHIKSVEFKYGCYLLNTFDLNDINYLIIINNDFVLENIMPHSVFKLYKPFTVHNFNNFNVICNLYKFEHHSF